MGSLPKRSTWSLLVYQLHSLYHSETPPLLSEFPTGDLPRRRWWVDAAKRTAFSLLIYLQGIYNCILSIYCQVLRVSLYS